MNPPPKPTQAALNWLTVSPLGSLTLAAMLLGTLMGLAQPRAAMALDDEHWRKANEAMLKGIQFLRASQNEDGSWTPKPGPAVTALITWVLLERPDIAPDDPQVAKAIEYILSKRQDDGGIYDGILANYNTSISISALSRVYGNPEAAAAVGDALKFLRGLQWNGQKDPEGRIINENHPYFGGVGYGGSGRPDMSNTHFMVQALHDAGVDCNDPIFQRAITFIGRCQGVPQNDMFADKINNDGGFIYSTSINKDLIGVPESKANPKMMDEAKQGKPVSGLRTYGSITYVGFMSFAYAQLERDDPRVQAAVDWIGKNYTLEQNPGMPESIKYHGYYYYFMTFGKAMDAWGTTYITDEQGNKHNWANDLVDKLVSLQREDGSWVNEADRWMEDDPNLVTAYAMIALAHAMR